MPSAPASALAKSAFGFRSRSEGPVSADAVEEVDAAARITVAKAGMRRYFTHSAGHGLGLEVHENPAIASSSNTKLREGMLFTVEPGLYFPGKFGIRLEEMVLVTAKGARRLSSLPMVLTFPIRQ